MNSPILIDARPASPSGLLATTPVLGKPVLCHHLALAGTLSSHRPVQVHARLEDHPALQELLGSFSGLPPARLVPGPPPEGSCLLRTDRLYDSNRLRRALHRGRDPETAILWRLDNPSALAGADDELLRRNTYQPLGRFWALPPAKALARSLVNSSFLPNHLTLLSAALMLAAAALVAVCPGTWPFRIFCSLALAIALVLDTADGHLARLQGTASRFGQWLDSTLDELADMALHAGIAWACFQVTAQPRWLLLGFAYAAGKYLFNFSNHAWEASDSRVSANGAPDGGSPSSSSFPRRFAHALGHADFRWHLWIVLALLGLLKFELIAFTLYYPARTLAGALRKHGEPRDD